MIILDYPGHTSVITRILYKREVKRTKAKRDGMLEAEVEVMCFQDEGKNYKPRNAGSLLESERRECGFSPEHPQGVSTACPLILVPLDLVWASAHQNCKRINSCYLSHKIHGNLFH